MAARALHDRVLARHVAARQDRRNIVKRFQLPVPISGAGQGFPTLTLDQRVQIEVQIVQRFEHSRFDRSVYASYFLPFLSREKF